MNSNSTSRLWWLLKQVWQFTRFAVVGALNTGIDFAITNILVLMLQPSSGVVLFLISVVACGVATLNSYVLNRRWTFADVSGPADRAEKLKFAAVAGLSMVINTTSFLFLVRFLPRYLPPELPEWLGVPGFILVVNLAKFGGVLAAFILSFLGFRFGVFKTEAVHTFRETFAFPAAPDRGGHVQALAAVGLAVILRLLLVLPGAPLSGDAVVSATAARDVVAGGWAAVEPAGLSLFTAWQALLLATGMDRVAAAVVASLVPGVLLLLPVVWITRTLYGAQAAWLAALFTAAHPRLMEYSVNGEAFSFYLCAFTAGVWALVRLARGGGLGAGAAVGAAFGLAAAVHNDGFAAFVVALPLAVGLARPSRGRLTRRGGEAGGRWPARLAVGAAAAAAFAAIVIGWVLATPAAPGDGGLFHVTAAPVRVFTERLDLAEAARAIYGEAATAARSVAPDRWSGWMAQAARVPQNLLYCLERTPGLLSTPVPLFLFLLPVFTGRWCLFRSDKLPLVFMMVLPVVADALLRVDTRNLLTAVVPVQVFGAAGLVAFAAYAARESRLPGLRVAVVAVILVISLGLAAWRAVELERQYENHHCLAGWLAVHVPGDAPVAGCAYGYIELTGFYSGHATVPRLWTERAEDLPADMDRRGVRWLILYEPFLRAANPTLSPALDAGVPGLRRAFVATDRRGLRAVVFERAP